MRHLILWLTLCAWGPATAAPLQPFVADSIADIEARYAGRPFIVALWSLTCPPCLHELELLGEWREANPDKPLVLIATDGEDQTTHIKAKLVEVGLDNADNWNYADTYVEKLRYNIDPNWHGELPRSYLYLPATERRAISGILTNEILEFLNE